ncbi:MAG: MG2 domain-containing protein [Sutterella sp.]|nr:MG2 domain-containing protein [Sutterella sp.]
MRLKAIALFTLLAVTLPPASAVPAADPARSWLKPSAEIPASGLSPLTISLAPDRQACEKTYGRRWESQCARPFGMMSARVQGVRLSPQIRGAWRWQSSDELAFFPAEPWPADAAFSVSLADLPVPAGVTLTRRDISFSTPPLSMTSGSARFWLDPAADGERSLSFEAFFSTAVADTSAVEKAFRLETDPQGPELGAPVFIWNYDRTSLYIRVPVVRAGVKAAVVHAHFPGIAGAWTAGETLKPAVTPGFETASLTVRVPAADGLYDITSAVLRPSRTAELERIYELRLRPSILTRPDRLAEALRVTELPARLNAGAASETDWLQTPVIDEDALDRGRPLAVTILQDKTTPSDTIRLAVKARPGTFIHAALPSGFGPSEDLLLKNGWQSVLRADDPGASVGFLEPGSMLTLSGRRTLTLTGEGIGRIRWRIERFRDPFLAMAAQQFRAHERFTDADAFAEAAEGIIPFGEGRRFASLPLDAAALPAGHSGLFQVTLVGEKQAPDGSWQAEARSSKRLLVTDTALIVKSERTGSATVFAADLATGRPAAGLSVTLLGANGVPLETVTTDENGAARFASISGFSREKTPAAVVARNAATGDIAWLSVTDPSNIDRLADFDVSGREIAADGLTGLVFADRGLYRPGETLHVGALVKSADMSALPAGLPVTLRITDDAGRIRHEAPLTLSAEGLAETRWTLPADGIAGRLQIDLLAGGGVLSGTSVRAEDFAPENMTLSARPAVSRRGWLMPEEASVRLSLRSNFGTGASGREVRPTLTLRPAGTVTFPGWAGWTFADPRPYDGRLPAMTLPSIETDSRGEGTVVLPAETLAAGTARASLVLEGFEAAGTRAATESLSMLISPASRMLGWRPSGRAHNLSWLPAGEPAAADIAVLTRTLEAAGGERLTVTQARRQYVTELTSDSRGMLRYRERAVETPVSETSLTLDENGFGVVPFDTSVPGDMTAVVRDADGSVLARIPYRVTGEDLRIGLSGSLPAAAAKLSSEKNAYSAGESAHLEILSPFSGFALLTLEADRVLESRWVPVRAGRNQTSLPIGTAHSGRAWLSASLVRGRGDAARFLKPYARAVVPVMLNTRERALGLSVEAPEQTGSPTAVEAVIRAEVPGKAFVWAVDDGILALTDYRTPSPFRAMLEDRALQVDTRQTLDGLMPEGVRLPGEAPYGGGFEAARALAAGQVNPFRRSGEAAVVWWGGALNVGPDGTPVTIRLPDTFSGRVRVMAAGASDVRIGSAETAVTVRQPLILTPQLPIFAAPGDRLLGGVTLSSEKPFEGTLSVRLPDSVQGGLSESVALSGPGDLTRTFSLALPAEPGPVRLTFAADGGAEHAERHADLSVRPAGLYGTETHWARFRDRTSQTLAAGGSVLPFKSRTELRVSSTPAPAVRALMDELTPGGWDDPTVRIAEALPWAALKASPGLAAVLGFEPDAFEKEADVRIGRALRSIEDRLGWHGVSSWSEASELASTAMALDFVLTLRRAGITVPTDMTRSLTRALGGLLDGMQPASLAESRTAAWALALMTREGTLAAERIEALRRSMTRTRQAWTTDAAAGFIASAYRDMRMLSEAEKLLTVRIGAPAGTDDTPSELGGLSAPAAVSALLHDADSARQLLTLLEKRAPGSLSLRERSYAARALIEAGFSPAGRLPDGIALSCSRREAGFDDTADAVTRTETGITLSAPGCRRFEVSAPGGLSGLWWQTFVSGWPAGDGSVASADGIEISKRLLDEEGRPVGSLRTGDAVTVEIRARRTAGNDASPVVITDLLPGGFELSATRSDVNGEGILHTVRGGDRLQLAVFLSSYERIYTYRIHALAPGSFTVPPAEAEDASAPHIRARGTSEKVTVDR